MKTAHIRPDSDKSQSIKDHSYAVAEMAQQFAVEPLKQVTYITGLLHDIGKYQDSFQNKILYGKKHHGSIRSGCCRVTFMML